MATIEDYRQANSNIALVQSGSAGVNRSSFVIGALNDEAQLFDWDDIRRVFASANTDYSTYWNDFLGAVADPGPAGLQFDEGGTGLAAVASNEITLTTGGTTSNHTTMVLGLHYTVSNGFLVFDTRFNIGTLTSVAIEVGFSDAISETNGLAFSDHTVSGVTDVAANAVIVAFDSGGDANYVINSVIAGTPRAFDIGSAPGAGTNVTVRIVVDSSGNASVWFNGVLSQYITLAVATTAVLTPWFSVATLTGSARTLVADYFGIIGAR